MWMIYGANGYTGDLIAREAVRRGERPVLAGRNAAAVEALAGELGLPHRAFPLDEPQAVAQGLDGVNMVLSAAGPFVRTVKPLVAACLELGISYLDITGEIPVFESIFRRHERAVEAGVILLPGVGFDVVPTDCLAARLHAALPAATHLELAFYGAGTGWSRGTLKTMLEGLPNLGAVRRDGKLQPVPAAYDDRDIPFSCGPRRAMTIPWGDLATAYRTTGIPNIRVYSAMPPKQIRSLRRLRPLLPIAGLTPIKRLLQRWIAGRVTGPDAETRETARMYLWGRAMDAGAGRAVTATAEVPEGYAFTAAAAVECAVRVMAGGLEAGAWTPASAFGAELVEAVDGVVVGEIDRQG